MYKTTWQESSRWNMFKALGNDVAGQMQKEIKSSNFSPAKYKLKNILFSKIQFCLYLQIFQVSWHTFIYDTFFKGRLPEVLFDHIYFKVDFIFPSNFMKVVSPARNKRSLATNFKETRFIFLHFLLSFGICFPIISNISHLIQSILVYVVVKLKIKKKITEQNHV